MKLLKRKFSKISVAMMVRNRLAGRSGIALVSSTLDALARLSAN